MKQILQILNKAIAGPYYRQQLGLFLFIFFALFGTQPSLRTAIEFHHSVIQSILTDGRFLLIASICWTLYAIRAIHFVYQACQRRSYHFLQQLQVIPIGKRRWLLLQLQTILFAPVWLYGLFIFAIAFIEGKTKGGLLVAGILLALAVISVLIIEYVVRKGQTAISSTNAGKIWSSRPTLFSFLTRYILTEQLTTLFLLKLVGFFALYGMASLDPLYFEGRITWMLYLTMLVGHGILVYRNQQFMETKLFFIRNLPFKKLSIFLSLLLLYFLLLLPEYWALKSVALIQHQLMNYIWMIASGPAILLFFHALLYTEDMKMDAFIQLLFGSWIVLLFFSLSTNRWMIPLVTGTGAYLLFYYQYLAYERKAAIEKLE